MKWSGDERIRIYAFAIAKDMTEWVNIQKCDPKEIITLKEWGSVFEKARDEWFMRSGRIVYVLWPYAQWKCVTHFSSEHNFLKIESSRLKEV